MQAEQQANVYWARVTELAAVDRAWDPAQPLARLGERLGVHFALRGAVAREGTRLQLNLSAVDVAGERSLGTLTVAVREPAKAGAAAELPRPALGDALGRLTCLALREEVARARSRPDASLDARDLMYRAYVVWGDGGPGGARYRDADGLLERALRLAPDSTLGWMIQAQINLCECIRSWTSDTAPMERIGQDALDHFDRLNGDAYGRMMSITLRGGLALRHGRYDDALAVFDKLLGQSADNPVVLEQRALALLRLGRPAEALQAMKAVERGAAHVADDGGLHDALAAAIHFAASDDRRASQLARQALARASPARLRDPLEGAAILTLAAAEARAGHLDAARKALADLRQAVPDLTGEAQVRRWLRPNSPVAEGDALYGALRRAGLGG